MKKSKEKYFCGFYSKNPNLSKKVCKWEDWRVEDGELYVYCLNENFCSLKELKK